MEQHCIAMNTMHGVTLALFFVLIAVFLPHPSEVYAKPPSQAPCKFPAIFNFGDSNSDTGGASAAFGQFGPPHGETFFHAPAGRYCDGRLIIDFIAQSFGHPYLNAFLDSVGSNFSHGVNFATAGSTIRHQNNTSFSPFSLNVQSHQLFDFQRRSQNFRNKGGSLFKNSLPSKEYFSQALYIFDIGQNDLTSINFPNISPNQVEVSILDIVDHFKTVIKDVYGDGARYFWIHNTGPLGCLPYVRAPLSLNRSQVDQFGCAIPWNNLAQYFNNMLKEATAQLREELPQAAIVYVDVYSAKYELISHAKHLGFKNPLRACCGHGGGKYNYDVHIRCGATAIVKGKEILAGKSCKDPWVRINWDGAHYTEAANKWVFDQIVDGSYSDPPVPLKMACHKW